MQRATVIWRYVPSSGCSLQLDSGLTEEQLATPPRGNPFVAVSICCDVLTSTLYKMRVYPGASAPYCKMAVSTSTILQRGQRRLLQQTLTPYWRPFEVSSTHPLAGCVRQALWSVGGMMNLVRRRRPGGAFTSCAMGPLVTPARLGHAGGFKWVSRGLKRPFAARKASYRRLTYRLCGQIDSQGWGRWLTMRADIGQDCDPAY